MSSGQALISRQTIFAAALETVAGTAIAAGSLATGDTAFNAFNADIQPDDAPNEREGQGSLSQMPSVIGPSSCSVKLTTELANSGGTGVPLWYSRLLMAAGFSDNSGTATPISGSSGAATLTCGLNVDGLIEMAAGVTFDFEMVFESGKVVQVNWTGKGIYQDPVDEAMLELTGVSAIPPKFQGATFTLGGAAVVSPKCTLRMQNDVQLRPDGASAGGYKSSIIVARKAEWDIQIEKSLIATKDWPGIAKAGTEMALVAGVGSGSNNVVTVNAPKLQLRSRPKRTSENGIEYWSLTCGANRDAAAGDDELSVVLS